MKKTIWFTTILMLLLCGISASAGTQYSKLLKNQGFKTMKTPRSAFGTGTIIGKLGNLKDEPLATPEQCFPDLESSLVTQELVLTNSHQEKKLGINATANFVPGGGGVLGKIVGAFNFNKVKNLDVSFGKTTGYDWTLVAFEQYLEGKKISKACYRQLTAKDSKIILSTAKVDSMTYTLNGDFSAGTTVNAELLSQALTLGGGITYSNVTRNSFTINSPMYIAYKAVSFKDAGLNISESAGDDIPSIILEKGAFKIKLKK